LGDRETLRPGKRKATGLLGPKPQIEALGDSSQTLY